MFCLRLRECDGVGILVRYCCLRNVCLYELKLVLGVLVVVPSVRRRVVVEAVASLAEMAVGTTMCSGIADRVVSESLGTEISGLDGGDVWNVQRSQQH